MSNSTPAVIRWGQRLSLSLLKILPGFIVNWFKFIDSKVDGGISFFVKHWGKNKFMISMSKKAQVLGIERLWEMSPKAFVYFFLFYLVRDTVLYIIIPIFLAKATS